MTRFTGPVKVKQAFSEAIVASIDENGIIKSGAAGESGFAQLVQQSTLTASNTTNATAAVLPDGSDVLDIRFFVENAFATAAADVQVRVGTSANETLFGTISIDTNIAGGMHVLTGTAFTSAGTSWNGLTGAGAKIMAQVTAVSGAIASGASGKLSITYVNNG